MDLQLGAFKNASEAFGSVSKAISLCHVVLHWYPTSWGDKLNAQARTRQLITHGSTYDSAVLI